MNLANNHIFDYLWQGFEDTMHALTANGIKYFGEGNSWVTEVKDYKIGFLGYMGFYASQDILN